jgi:hypothetical protein
MQQDAIPSGITISLPVSKFGSVRHTLFESCMKDEKSKFYERLLDGVDFAPDYGAPLAPRSEWARLKPPGHSDYIRKRLSSMPDNQYQDPYRFFPLKEQLANFQEEVRSLLDSHTAQSERIQRQSQQIEYLTSNQLALEQSRSVLEEDLDRVANVRDEAQKELREAKHDLSAAKISAQELVRMRASVRGHLDDLHKIGARPLKSDYHDTLNRIAFAVGWAEPANEEEQCG